MVKTVTRALGTKEEQHKTGFLPSIHSYLLLSLRCRDFPSFVDKSQAKSDLMPV